MDCSEKKRRLTAELSYNKSCGQPGQEIRMIGQLATSKAGHDKERLYVIVAQKGDDVYLCDGDLRLPEKPKKKRMKHIQPINDFVDEKLCSRLLNGEKVYGEEIKYALKQYLKKTCI